jgi:hypothetical protein
LATHEVSIVPDPADRWMASGLFASTNITRKQRTNEIPQPVVALI